MARTGLCVTFVVAFALASEGFGAVRWYTGGLNGPSENPPNASIGTGTTLVRYDDVAHTLDVTVSFTGLVGTTSVAHIHCCVAPPGTAPVAVDLTGFPAGVTSGNYYHYFDLTSITYGATFLANSGGTQAGAEAALAAGLASGMSYVNIHTNTFPGGEIRSFLAEVDPPTLAKSFGTKTVFVGQTTSLTFGVTNPNPTAALSGVGFTDTLPAGLVVATPNGLTNTCGGSVTATAGSGAVSLAGGSIAAAGSCSITVDITATAEGILVNTTGQVTSNEGGAGNSASATLEAVTPPIPTLGAPGLLALVMLLAFAALLVLRRTV